MFLPNTSPGSLFPQHSLSQERFLASSYTTTSKTTDHSIITKSMYKLDNPPEPRALLGNFSYFIILKEHHENWGNQLMKDEKYKNLINVVVSISELDPIHLCRWAG